jgi:hypothetical protein
MGSAAVVRLESFKKVGLTQSPEASLRPHPCFFVSVCVCVRACE